LGSLQGSLLGILHSAIRVRIPAGWQGAQQSQYAAAPNFHQAPPPQARMGYGSGVDGVSG